MAGGYSVEDLDGAIFGEALKAQLRAQRCPQPGCGGELAWTVSAEQRIQIGQAVTVRGRCRKCRSDCEIEMRL